MFASDEPKRASFDLFSNILLQIIIDQDRAENTFSQYFEVEHKDWQQRHHQNLHADLLSVSSPTSSPVPPSTLPLSPPTSPSSPSPAPSAPMSKSCSSTISRIVEIHLGKALRDIVNLGIDTKKEEESDIIVVNYKYPLSMSLMKKTKGEMNISMNNENENKKIRMKVSQLYHNNNNIK